MNLIPFFGGWGGGGVNSLPWLMTHYFGNNLNFLGSKEYSPIFLNSVTFYQNHLYYYLCFINQLNFPAFTTEPSAASGS